MQRRVLLKRTAIVFDGEKVVRSFSADQGQSLFTVTVPWKVCSPGKRKRERERG